MGVLGASMGIEMYCLSSDITWVKSEKNNRCVRKTDTKNIDVPDVSMGIEMYYLSSDTI